MEVCVGSAPEDDDLGPSLLKEEIMTMLKELKNGKTEGVDDISGEMLKCLGEKATKELIKICQQIYTLCLEKKQLLCFSCITLRTRT